MRAVIQRVSRAVVRVEGVTVGEIGRGFLVLLGVTHSDGHSDADWMARKIAGLRLFAEGPRQGEDDAGKMNLGLSDVGGAALVVSQFTLYGDVRKGRRPSFTDAARPEQAEPLIDYFVERLLQEGIPVQTGQFQAMMEVELVNDGPVTLLLDTVATPE